MDIRSIKKQIKEQTKPELGNVDIASKGIIFSSKLEDVIIPNIIWAKTFFIQERGIGGYGFSLDDFSDSTINTKQILLDSNSLGALIDTNTEPFINAMYSTWVYSNKDVLIRGTFGGGGFFWTSVGQRLLIFKRIPNP